MIAAAPLTIADIFDRTVTIMVRRWRTIAVIASLNAAPAVLSMSFRGTGQPSRPLAVLDVIVTLLAGALTFSPFVRLGGGDQPGQGAAALLRAAVRDYWRSLGAFILIYAVLLGLFAVALLIVVPISFVTAPLLGRSGIVVAGVVACALLVVCIPALVVTNVAYANVILDVVGPWRGLTSAVARCRHGGIGRTWLLGAALLVVLLAPLLMLDAVLRPLATSTGLWWIALPIPLVSSATGAAFVAIAGAVAAVDYRNRSEGADLQAELDAAEAPS